MAERMTEISPVAAVTRRGFIKGAAGITFVIGASGLVAACGTEREAEVLARFEANVWATITPDGRIAVMVAAAEMGQGPMTSLPLIFAEEADADWNDIVPVQVTELRKEYGNPFFGGIIYTGGSRAVDDYYLHLRRAGAQTRLLLMMAAAEHWQVPLGELSTEPSVVIHKASGRRLGYGDIAAFAEVPDTLPEITDADLKARADFRLIGRDMPRIDAPLKVRGAAQYAMDVRVPGMVYAAMLHAPVEGETPLRIDDTATREVDGVVDVVKIDNGVAVIGETVEATRFGKDLLDIEWTTTMPGQGHSSAATLAKYSKAANNLELKGTPWRAEGDVDAAFAGAAEIVTHEYLCDHVYHAQMEPLNATAFVNEAGDGADLWCGTQSQSLTMLTAAKTLGTTTEKIKLHQMYLGGGFGRRAELEPTYVIEAIQLSRHLKKPVKVIWSREDDLEGGWFRPSTAQLMRAGFDKDGNVIAWNHRMAGPSVLAFYNSWRWSKTGGKDVISMLGSEIPNYAIPNMLAEHVMLDRTARLSPWRGVGTGYTKFAVESFVDELAESRGEDPIEFRLERLLNNERARHVLRAAAAAAEWGKPRAEGRALGVGVAEYHGSVAAAIVEISVNRKSGRITPHDVWIAADPGLVVQPLNVETQIEGAVIYGLGQAIMERVTIERGQVEQSNFHDYHVMRMTDIPDIHVEVFSTDNHPTGVGELGLPMMGGAVANAFKALTGKRIRHMPLTPERVLEALRA